MEYQRGMEYQRLVWASRRGMLELDLILNPFLERIYPSLPEEDKQRYRKLLECEDQDLFNWFLNKGEPADDNLKKIVGIIRSNTGLQMNG